MTTTTGTTARRTGTALPICLVFLLLLSVLAIATVNTATLGIAMAANSQHVVDAFYLAENAIERSLETFADQPGLLNSKVPYVIRRTAIAGRGAYEATTRFAEYGKQCTTANDELMTRLHFDVAAKGYATRNAFAQHTQGVFVCRLDIPPGEPNRSEAYAACTVTDCPGLPSQNIPVRTFWTDHGD